MRCQHVIGSALARALGLTVDQVGAFRDVGAYVAAVESGTVDSEDLRARRAVIRFHLRELDEAVLLRGEALPFLLEGIV